jgi:tetrapyrrole methylase family protein/MazG family protein
MSDSTGSLFESLLGVMARLRGDGGCPWDREQTRASLKPFLIEEVYEALEALEEGQPEAIMEELGDVLFQVIFHAHVAQELGEFTMDDLLQRLVEKMVRRHPHVFGDTTVESARHALAQWEAIKRSEGDKNGQSRSVLSGVPGSLPALLRSQRIQAKAARVGFDWPNPQAVWAKVREEIQEMDDALARGDRTRVAEELGDLLFSIVNMARHLDMDAEGSLRQAVEKFTRRFNEMEREITESGATLSGTPLEALDRAWEAIKARETHLHGQKDRNA